MTKACGRRPPRVRRSLCFIPRRFRKRAGSAAPVLSLRAIADDPGRRDRSVIDQAKMRQVLTQAVCRVAVERVR